MRILRRRRAFQMLSQCVLSWLMTARCLRAAICADEKRTSPPTWHLSGAWLALEDRSKFNPSLAQLRLPAKAPVETAPAETAGDEKVKMPPASLA